MSPSRITFFLLSVLVCATSWGQIETYARYGVVPKAIPLAPPELGQLGRAVAPIGDLNGNGRIDLAVSGSIEDNGILKDAIHIFFMGLGGVVDSVYTIDGTGPMTGFMATTGQGIGLSLAPAGDLNNDGTPDLAVGAPQSNAAGTSAGGIYFFHLTPEGRVLDVVSIDRNTAGFSPAPDIGSGFGATLVNIGDLDLDGRDEFFVGAPLSAEGGPERGSGFILFLDDELHVDKVQQLAKGLGGLGPWPVSDSCHFSWAGSRAGDLDGNGVPDIVVATHDQLGNGSVHLLLLNKDGSVAHRKELTEVGGAPLACNSMGSQFGRALTFLQQDDGLSRVAVATVSGIQVLDINEDGEVVHEQEISNTASQGTFYLPYDSADSFSRALCSGIDMDGNGSMDLMVGAPNALIGTGWSGTIWVLGTEDPAPRPSINAVVKTLTATNSSTGTIEVIGLDLPQPGTALYWTSHATSEMRLTNLKDEMFALTATLPDSGTISKVYSMGYPAHWRRIGATTTHRQDLQPKDQSEFVYTTVATNHFSGPGAHWVEYTHTAGAGTFYFGFHDSALVVNDHTKLSAGLLFTADDRVFSTAQGEMIFLGTARTGDVFKIVRSGTIIAILKDGVPYPDPITSMASLKLYGGVVGYGSALNGVRTSNPPGLAVDLVVQHVTPEEPAIGSITPLTPWGIPPYSYLWNEDQITSTITNLKEGAHSVVVTDALGDQVEAFAKVASHATVFSSEGIQFENNELQKISEAGWESASGLSENIVAAGDSGWVQIKIIDPEVALAIAFVDTVRGATFSMVTANGKVSPEVLGNKVGITHLAGKEGDQLALKNGDVLAIQRVVTGTAVEMHFKLNGKSKLSYTDGVQERELALDLQLSEAGQKAEQLIGRFSRSTQFVDCNTPWNYAIQTTYYEDGSISSMSKVFMDHLGRTIQVQAKDLSANNVLVTQTVHDRFGRPALQTLPAPIYTTSVNCYRSGFITTPNDDAFAAAHFDRPVYSGAPGEVNTPLGVRQTTQGTLGWYYSDANSREKYVPASAYPYARTIYQHDATGKPMAVHGPGEAHKAGSGHGTRSFTFNGGDILPRFSHPSKWGSLNVHKTISIGPDGIETIAYSNEEGQLLATCRSGMASDCPLQEMRTRMETDGERHVDIHVPASQKQVHGNVSSVRLPRTFSSTFDGNNQVNHRLMDIATGKVLELGLDYQYATVTVAGQNQDRYVRFLGGYATGPSYLRVSYELNLVLPATPQPHQNPTALRNLPDQEVWYTLDYGHWSLRQYSEKGELITVVPPEGVNCDVEYVYSVESYHNNDTEFLSLCTWGDVPNDGTNDLVRLPGTVDEVVGTVLFDFEQDIVGAADLPPPGSISSTIIVDAVLFGAEMIPIEDDHIGHIYAERDARTNPCNYVFHDPNPPVVLTEAAKDLEYMLRQQNIDIPIRQEKRHEPFRPIAGSPKLLNPNPVNEPWDPWDEPSPQVDPCEGHVPQAHGRYRIVLDYYYLDSDNGNAEVLFDTQVHGATVMRTCDCELYWSTGVTYPVVFPPDIVAHASSFRIKLKEVLVNTTWNAWEPFLPYNQNQYIHDLVRFLMINLNIEKHSEPVLVEPIHRMQQTYTYDDLSQLVQSTDPDRGSVEMVYDERGMLRFSQDAQQAVAATDGTKRFSFVDYDQGGRTSRTGVARYHPGNSAHVQFRTAQATGSPPLLSTTTTGVLNGSQAFPVGQVLEEVNELAYDMNQADFPSSEYPSYEQHVPPGALARSGNAESTTWYSYDVRGRLSWTIHHTVGLAKYHTLHYYYNGKGQLERASYQQGEAKEWFDHWYLYDRNGRLRKVLTGNDGLLDNAAERAEYRYYAHGPLKRVELGDDLQGMDHVYTIQGWLKAINSPDEQWRDPGKDGVAGTTNAAFAPDLFGMALDYFNGDYIRSGSGITSHIGTEVAGLAPDNYNGLVRAQRWNNRALTNGLYNLQGQALCYSYNYDALGQLTKAQLSTVHGTAQAAAPLAAYLTVKEDYKTWGMSYDWNGNLLTLNRHGQTPQGLAMDQLSYHYTEDAQGNKTHNRLAQVTNAVSSFNYPNTGLPPNQGTDNYTYNELGQLVGDTKDSRYFSYYAHGRVKTVYSDPARTFKLAHFTYDAQGKRLMKESYATDGSTPTERTWYLRDASGAVISYIQQDLIAQTRTEELPIAGVGSYLREAQTIRYDISDHLGNTRVSFIEGTNGLDMIEAHDYYPHGGLLPGRQLNGSNGSPLAYQGQEFDPEVGLTAFDLRQYDARLGRWLTTDPYGQHHSPYLAMSNNPVSFVDPDGGHDYLPNANDEVGWRQYHQRGRDEFTQYVNSVYRRNAEGESGVWDSWSNLGGGIEANGQSRGMDGMIRETMSRFYERNRDRIEKYVGSTVHQLESGEYQWDGETTNSNRDGDAAYGAVLEWQTEETEAYTYWRSQSKLDPETYDRLVQNAPRQDFSGILGTLDYVLNGDERDGFRYSASGKAIGLATCVNGVVPPIIGPGFFKAVRVVNGLEIGRKALSMKTAIKRLQGGKDVYATSRKLAKQLMKKASDAGKVIKDKAHKEGYLDHYHDLLRKIKGHSFFE